MTALPLPSAKPQFVELWIHSVPVSFGMLIVLLPLAGATKFKVLVTPPLVAANEVEAPPCRVKVWPVEPTVRVPAGVIVRVPVVFEMVGLDPVKDKLPPVEIPEASVNAPTEEMVLEELKN